MPKLQSDRVCPQGGAGEVPVQSRVHAVAHRATVRNHSWTLGSALACYASSRISGRRRSASAVMEPLPNIAPCQHKTLRTRQLSSPYGKTGNQAHARAQSPVRDVRNSENKQSPRADQSGRQQRTREVVILKCVMKLDSMTRRPPGASAGKPAIGPKHPPWTLAHGQFVLRNSPSKGDVPDW